MRFARSATIHVLQALLEGAIVASLVAVLIVGTAFAAKGGNGSAGKTNSTATMSLVMVRDANGDGLPNYMDDITFNVSTTVAKPYVGLRCWQGTNFVYDGYVGYWSGYMFTPYFTLASNYWAPSLAASCTARLFYYDSRGREHVLNTMTFPVEP